MRWKTLGVTTVAVSLAGVVAGCGAPQAPARTAPRTPVATATPTATPNHKTASVWINKAACAGEAAATAGNWSAAQQEFLLAEETTKNLGASTVFASLGLDVASVSLDQLGDSIAALTAHDISTYQRDLKKGRQWFKACAP